jgi:GNAT superfamily N-acetyltransferase
MSEFFRTSTAWSDGDMEMRTLDGPPPPGFDCGAADQNAFLYLRAWADACHGISVTHMLFIKGIPAAYVTLLSDRIQLGPKEKPKGVTYQFVPAMKVGQLGVDRRFAGQGLGRYMLGFVVQLATQFRGVFGCRYVTLDAEPHLIGWYESQGFRRNLEEQRHRLALAQSRGRPVDTLAVSMRFDLRDSRLEGVSPAPPPDLRS